MTEKLTWNEIEKKYPEEWIELIEYDWPEGTPNPKSGVVTLHSPERKEFHRLLRERTNKPLDSAFVFVGEPTGGPNEILVSSLVNI